MHVYQRGINKKTFKGFMKIRFDQKVIYDLLLRVLLFYSKMIFSINCGTLIGKAKKRGRERKGKVFLKMKLKSVFG